MLTVIIKDSGEPSVIALTYQNLFKELKDISGSELLVADDWFGPLPRVRNTYVCFVEADCLVNSGYFESQLGLFRKNPMFRKIAMMSSATGVNDWANKFFGYRLGNNYSEGVIPEKTKRSSAVYPIQIGYVPGSVIRVATLKHLLGDLKPSNSWQDDLVYFSTQISLGFWNQGDGNRVHLNPNSTYVTTEEYVNDIGQFETEAKDLVLKFAKESI
jgi:hypothetical protein